MVWYKPRTWFKNTPTETKTTTPNIGSGGIVNLSGGVNGTLSGGNVITNTGGAISGNTLSGNVSSGNILSGNTLTGINVGTGTAPTINSTVTNNAQTPQISQIKFPTIFSGQQVNEPQATIGPIDNPDGETIFPFKDDRSWYQKWKDRTYGTTNFEGTMSSAKAAELAWKEYINKDKSHTLDEFRSDIYANSGTNIADDPITFEVESESKKNNKTWSEVLSEARGRNITNILNGGEDIGARGVFWNAVENKLSDWPVIGGHSKIEDEIQAKYGGELTNKLWEDKESPLQWVSYNGPNKIEFKTDIGEIINKAYEAQQGIIPIEEYVDFVEDRYEHYKDNFAVEVKGNDPGGARARRYSFSLEDFEDFIDNEYNKMVYRQEQTEKRGLPNEDDTSAAVISKVLDYGYAEFLPALEKSNIRTVEDREERMNDYVAALTEQAGRMYTRLHPALRVKASLQKDLGVDNLYDLDEDEVPDVYQDLYRRIKKIEKDYNTFIRNYVSYQVATLNYVNPETGRMDSHPEYVYDDGVARTFEEWMFRDIDITNNDKFLYARLFNGRGGMSPIDILQQEAMSISYDYSELTDGYWSNTWSRFQYGGAQVGAILDEGGQRIISWPVNKVRNIFSWDSGDIPYEFVEMDSSITSNMTTNDSNRGRTLQNFSSNTLEYVPELYANIRGISKIDSSMTKLGEAGQVRLLARLNKMPFFTNTVEGRQFAQFLAYGVRFAQRYGTDQIIIDPIAAIGDTEFGSDTSKMWSRYGTLFGEGLGVLADLRVLGKSVLLDFKKTNEADSLFDPIRLIHNNPRTADGKGILDNYAASIGRTSKDMSGKIYGDQYKLLVQDLSSYSKYLNKMSNRIIDFVSTTVKNGGSVDDINLAIKQGAYKVLKQVFAQNSAMSKIITDLLTDNRANIADMLKYIGDLEGTIKIGPFISTIKIDKGGQLVTRVAKNYDEGMDLVIDGGLVAGINRGLTKEEINELVRQGYIKSSAVEGDVLAEPNKYFAPWKMPDGSVRYFPTNEGLKILGLDATNTSNPLAIAIMTEDTRQLIDKLKSIPESQRALSDLDLEQLGEIDAVRRLAENIAGIKTLDICK